MKQSPAPLFIRIPLPQSHQDRLDALCKRAHSESGMAYGDTAAACLAAGLRYLERAPTIYSVFGRHKHD